MDRPRRSGAGLRKATPYRAPEGQRAAPEGGADIPETGDERRLVERARQGDEAALESLYRSHYDRIYRYCYYRLGSAEAAEDATAQVFLGMVRALPRFEWRGKPFVAWLYGIARKQAALWERESRRADPPSTADSPALPGDGGPPEALLEQQEQRVVLIQALGELPDTQREVIVLRYGLSLSLEETAAALGRSAGAVKQLQLRALAALRAVLGNKEEWL